MDSLLLLGVHLLLTERLEGAFHHHILLDLLLLHPVQLIRRVLVLLVRGG
jgi:hypothetical protein